MAYDLLIKNAQICDGVGTPVYGGGLAVSDGKIVEVGKVSGSARREINADGLVLAPALSTSIPTTTPRSRGTRC